MLRRAIATTAGPRARRSFATLPEYSFRLGDVIHDVRAIKEVSVVHVKGDVVPIPFIQIVYESYSLHYHACDDDDAANLVIQMLNHERARSRIAKRTSSNFM